ncbi:hypothetical protein CLU79DRAFT_841064 [Phycomyces nitens]|nr:hypothetical protein CLU79DRAFT_841064 [Phycomyces nitens]
MSPPTLSVTLSTHVPFLSLPWFAPCLSLQVSVRTSASSLPPSRSLFALSSPSLFLLSPSMSSQLFLCRSLLDFRSLSPWSNQEAFRSVPPICEEMATGCAFLGSYRFFTL